MTATRERTHTMDSVSSFGSGGGLRERANTAGSMRSTHSGDGPHHLDELHEDFPLTPSPQRRRSSLQSTTTSHGGRKTARKLVEWLQRQRVPAPLYRQGRRLWFKAAALMPPKHSSGNNNSNSSNNVSQYHVTIDVQEDAVYWIEGLDRVVFGTSSCSEVVRIVGVQPPRYLWYMVSGAVCDVWQLCMDVALTRSGTITDASACWALTFFASIVARHSSHRYLVFGDYVGGYTASLLRMYGGYSVIIVLSTLFNMAMTRVAAVSHYVAWILTLLWTGIANYFILKKLWTFGGKT